MASENETVADIVKELRDQYEDATDICVLDAPEYADRFEAAHKREVAELRECLKEAVFVMQALFDKQMPKWCKALEGGAK